MECVACTIERKVNIVLADSKYMLWRCRNNRCFPKISRTSPEIPRLLKSYTEDTSNKILFGQRYIFKNALKNCYWDTKKLQRISGWSWGWRPEIMCTLTCENACKWPCCFLHRHLYFLSAIRTLFAFILDHMPQNAILGELCFFAHP